MKIKNIKTSCKKIVSIKISNLRYLQNLLGNSLTKIIEIYTNIIIKWLDNITSQIDD